MQDYKIKAKEMFIVKALEKILAEKDIKRSHHSQLKKAAEGAIASLKGKLALMPQVHKKLTK